MKKVSYSPQEIAMPELENHQSLKNDAPNKIISIHKAINDYNNFYNTRIVNDPSDQTRAVWFDFTILANYLSSIEAIAIEKGVEITRLAFLFGADSENKRTVFIAPMTFDKKFETHRAFSIDNNQITFLHRFAIEKYSDINSLEGLHSTDQSMILGSNRYLTSAEAIVLYNNYFDAKVRPISDLVKDDTRHVFYEKGVFEEYLSYIKDESSKNDIDISGINFVFSSYDDDDSLGLYANHQNIFFLPTNSLNKEHIPFTSFEKSESRTFDLSSNTLAMVQKELLSSLFNRGQGVPPYGDWGND